MENDTINGIDKVRKIELKFRFEFIQDQKKLLDTLQRDENSNKYYYDKMLSDFEMESRHEEIKRKKRIKWRAESQKYNERVQNMKEKKEEIYSSKMNKLQKDIKQKEKEIKNRIEQNQKIKDEERKHSLEKILQKEKSAKYTYFRKLRKDEKEREENEKKILAKCKRIILIFNIKYLYFYSGIIQSKE